MTGSFRQPVDVLIQGNRIRQVGMLNERDKTQASLIDCSGKYLLPGLFESHAHLSSLSLLDTHTKERYLSQFIDYGITQVRDVGGPIDVLQAMQTAIREGELRGPEIFYAGPMLEKSPLGWEKVNTVLPDFTMPIDSKEDVEARIAELIQGGASFAKTFNKFDHELHTLLFTELKNKAQLQITHDPGPWFFQSISFEKGIELGITCFEHAHNVWSSVLTEEFNQEYSNLLKQETTPEQRVAFSSKVARAGVDSIDLEKLKGLLEKCVSKQVYFCPTLTVADAILSETALQEAEQIGLPYTQEEIESWKSASTLMGPVLYLFVQKMAETNVKLLVGHDGYDSEFTLREMEAFQQAGVPKAEIIKAATIYPAEWLGLTESFGSLTANRKANILVLDKNPLDHITNIRSRSMVLKEGQIIYQKSED